MPKIHIDEYVEIKFEKDAEDALAKQNDIHFLTDKGLNKISEDRWNLAQQAEKRHWFTFGAQSSDDRNYEHSQNFNQYKDLHGITFQRAAEFGCGPFTNLRVIAQHTTIKQCVLIDPLINDYLSHSGCRYKDGKFLVSDTGDNIPIEQLLPIVGEKVSDPLNCDLVVCVNVLEHCYDAEMFFNNLWNACADGSFIVFHDRFYTYDKAKQSVENIYDAAHPLRVGKEVTEAFLNKFKQVLRVDSGAYNSITDAVQDMVYFIGKKE